MGGKRAAQVFYDGRLAGHLRETARGFSFQYEDTYLAGGTPISFTLPLRVVAYESKNLHGFFENLVAEGWLRRLQTQQQRIDATDRFGLLLANGRDLVGAVTILPAVLIEESSSST